MPTQTTPDDGGKRIRYNVPTEADKAKFGDTENYTLHVGGVTVFFDRILEKRNGHVFIKCEEQVAYVNDGECDVSPCAAMRSATENPNEKIPFADQ